MPDIPLASLLTSPPVQQAVESYYAVREPHSDPVLNAIALAILIEDMTGERLTDDDIESLSVQGTSMASVPLPSQTPDL